MRNKYHGKTPIIVLRQTISDIPAAFLGQVTKASLLISFLLPLLLMAMCLVGCSEAPEGQSAGGAAPGSTAADTDPVDSIDTAGPADTADEQTRILVATDLHYLARPLMTAPEKVRALCESSDGKLTEHSPEIVETFCQEVIDQAPDALVLAGDLTFNGEIVSLRHLQKALKDVEKAGIPVLAIPGNHDIECRYAYSFTPGEITPVHNISRTDYRLIMERFGYSEAVSRDEDSFSYAADVGDRLRLIFLDVNGDSRPGHRQGELTDGAMEWLRTQLEDAADSGRTVITVSHQNLLPQNDFLYEGYVMDNGDEIASLLLDYGVRCHLSGHSHLQHRASKKAAPAVGSDSAKPATGSDQPLEDPPSAAKITDICTGVLTGCTLNYGDLTVEDDGSFHYQIRHVDDPELQKLARSRAKKGVRIQVEGLLENYPALTAAEKKQMTDLAVKLNLDYFSGALTPARILEYGRDPALKLWTSEVMKDDDWARYVRSMLH